MGGAVTRVGAAARRVLFWVHLGCGVTVGVVILIMSITGAAMTYQRQVQAWADRGSWTPPVGAARLPLASLVTRVRDQQPRAVVTTVTVRQDPSALATVNLGGALGAPLQVDPYTGAIVPPGPHAGAVRSFFSTMNAWHRWLAREGEARDSSRGVVDLCNLIFFTIVLTGACLWWPRQFTRRAFGAVAWFRRGVRGRARDLNWHTTIGVWSLLPLMVIVGAGVVMSYPWANDLVYRVAGDTPPPRAIGPGRGAREGRGNGAGGGRGVRNGEGRAGSAAIAPRAAAGLDNAVVRVGQVMSGWRSAAMTLPALDGAPLIVTVDSGDGGQPQRRGTLTIDGRTGDVTKIEGFATQTRGRRRSLLRFAHTGEVFGVAGQTVAGLASLGAVVLVCTGLLMAAGRAYRWLRRARRSSPEVSVRRAA
jgi:uncharacterized iron-regulated membrane protein